MIYKKIKNGSININASMMTILSRMLCVSILLRLNGYAVIPSPSYEYVLDLGLDNIRYLPQI
jgi:hypothetical protein